MAASLELFPFQSEGVERIVRQAGRALLFDEPGLGKTCQTLMAAKQLNAFPLLIICPASLRLNWLKEIGIWLEEMTHETCVVLSGKKAKLDAKIVIVSYDLALRMEDGGAVESTRVPNDPGR